LPPDIDRAGGVAHNQRNAGRAAGSPIVWGRKMSQCVFCDILRGETAASFVHRDDRVSAFMDIQPVNPGHVLVIPNAHAVHLSDLDAETGAQIFRVAQRVAAALRRSGIPCEGVNFFLADGEVASQEVFHVHLHVFPRVRGDGFGLQFGDHYFTKPPRSVIEAAARKIREAIETPSEAHG
jgi:histidine triad (HIT) family protein